MNKKILIVNCIFLLLLIIPIFLKVIPIPVENTEGSQYDDKFIYGGIYWTSVLNELQVENYRGSFYFFGVFGLFFLGTNLLIKKKSNKQKWHKQKA